MKRTISVIMLSLILTSILGLAFHVQPTEADPKTIYVDDNNTLGPWDGTPEHPYQNITSGLEHALTNCVVYVYSGTYYEHVTIDKALSLVGEDKFNTIIDGEGTGTVLNIASNDTGVANFTIRNANIGIAFYHTWGWTFENYFSNNNVGMYLFRSPGNVVFRNTFSKNDVGIELNETPDTTDDTDAIFRNNISNNNIGIKRYQSHKSRFWSNNFIDNTNHVSSTNSGSKWTWFTAWLAYQGNYWSGYSGFDNFSGKFQNETGSDNIIDAPYNVTANGPVQSPYYPFWYVEDPNMFYSHIGNNTDYYPYTEPWIDSGWLWGIKDGSVWAVMPYTWTIPLQLEDRFILEGLVENPLNMTYKELLTFPLWSETATIFCGPPAPFKVITYEWIGLPLSCLLNLAKVEENATEVVFWGDDNFYSSLDIETAMEPNTLLALKGNETLLSEVHNASNLQRKQSGFRLVIPCRYGYKWVKNIVRIQVVDYDSKGSLEGLPYDWDADYNGGRIPNCTLPLRIRVPNGDFDLLIGSTNNTVIGYKNIGCSTTPEWTRETEWDIPDVPGDRDRASPSFGDLDNDGDYDLLISNARDNYPPMAYKNVGDMSHPVWERCTEWDVPNLHSYEQNPEVVDLDNDGDYDLLIGCIPGAAGEAVICAFENNGTAESPRWNRKPEWDLSCLPWSCPSAADLDHDGDFDLMVGQYYDGNIVAYGYENNGTASNPSWLRKLEWDAPIDPNVAKKHKRPALVDIDNDGDYDLFVGAGTDILAYENSGNSTSPFWSRKAEWDFPNATPGWTRPVFVDLDADIHDIEVSNVRLSKNVVGQGYSLKINVALVNHGNHTETFNVTVYANTTVIDTFTVTLSRSGQHGSSLGAIRTWDTTGFAKGNYTIWAYASPLPGETDTLDNTKTADSEVKIGVPGDLNGDNLCDLLDLVKVAGKFGKVLGDLGYDPNYDLNDDSIIDLLDLVKVALHFGETDP